MNILVTGSSGYLGDSFINIFEERYTFSKFSLLRDTIKNVDLKIINTVLHCAALVHQKIDYGYEEYYRINTKYPLDLARKAKVNGVEQFIFISTIAVYGETDKVLNESTLCNPVTSYGKSKLEAEKELKKLEDDSFIITIIRVPMIYGENAPGNIASLLKLVQKVPIIPLGSIDNQRSFIFIKNLCYVINQAIEQQSSGIFLVSDDQPLSTTRLIENIAQGLNKKTYLVKIPLFEILLRFLQPSFHKRLYRSLEVDNTLTKQKLNLKNPYSVEEGINLMVKGKSIRID